LIWALTRLHNHKILLLVLIFFSVFIPMTFIVNKQDRFLYMSMPCLFTITASFIVWLINRLKKRIIIISMSIFIILIGGDLIKLPEYYRLVGNLSNASPAYKIRNAWNYSTLYNLAQYPDLLRQPKIYLNPNEIPAIPETDIEEILAFIGTAIPEGSRICSLVQLVEISPYRWLWLSYEIRSRIIFNRWDPNSLYFISVEVEKNSPYYTLINKDYIDSKNRRWAILLKDLNRRGFLGIWRSKIFSESYAPRFGYCRYVKINHRVYRVFL